MIESALVSKLEYSRKHSSPCARFRSGQPRNALYRRSVNVIFNKLFNQLIPNMTPPYYYYPNTLIETPSAGQSRKYLRYNAQIEGLPQLDRPLIQLGSQNQEVLRIS